MEREELEKILEAHRLWLEETGGKKALLRGADLRGADLRDANLRGADLRDADLHNASLHHANLYDANLTDALLRNTDLDFSVMPLRCEGLGWNIDSRLAAQLAYHFCSMMCGDPEFIRIRNGMLDFANRFHRVEECGRLKPVPEQ
jgi:hypothetical protein